MCASYEPGPGNFSSANLRFNYALLISEVSYNTSGSFVVYAGLFSTTALGALAPIPRSVEKGDALMAAAPGDVPIRGSKGPEPGVDA